MSKVVDLFTKQLVTLSSCAVRKRAILIMKRKTAATTQPVQWFSPNEWMLVYESLFAPESDEVAKRRALQIMLTWKSRNPYLPSAVESTLGLLEVDLQLPLYERERASSDRLLRLAYAAVIMRFINHTLDDAQSKRFTLLQAAAHSDIPHWIIDLRHEAAHGHELPSLNMLKDAAHFAMNWLYRNYWQAEYEPMRGSAKRSRKDDAYEEMSRTMNVYAAVIVFRYSKMKRISDMPNEESRHELCAILENASEMLTLKDVSASLLRTVEELLNEFVNCPKYDETISKFITSAESPFISHDMLDPEKEHTDRVISSKCLHLWRPLLLLMHRKNIIWTLIVELLEIVNSSVETHFRRKVAAHWIKEILLGFVSLNTFKICCSNKIFRTDKHMIKTFHSIPKISSEECDLILDLSQDVPYKISNIGYIENVLKNLNPYLHIYAREFMKICNPALDEVTSKKLIMLVDIHLNKNSVKVSHNQVYTLEDVYRLYNEDKKTETENEHIVNNDNMNSNVWTLCSEKYEWNKCPIGLLPWQSNNMKNPLLLDG